MMESSHTSETGEIGQTIEMQQCIGPTCTYDASQSRSATGFTWKELQEYRENLIRKRYALKGIFDISPEMLIDRPVPTYEQFKAITSKPVKR